MHAAYRHGSPSLASLPKDDEVSCELTEEITAHYVVQWAVLEKMFITFFRCSTNANRAYAIKLMPGFFSRLVR